MESVTTPRRAIRAPLSEPTELAQASLLYMYSCQFERTYNKMVLFGYNPKGDVMGYVIDGYERYFFLQFHSDDYDPVGNPQQVDAYLRELQQKLMFHTQFTVPKAGNMSETETTYNSLISWKKKQTPQVSDLDLISRWQAVDGCYKTMYGWTPDMLTRTIQVWVTRPAVCDAICAFVESDEYFHYASMPVVRIFEGKGMSPEQQFRADRGLSISQYCHVLLRPRTYLADKQLQKRLLYSDREIHCHESAFTPLPPNTPTPPPLLRVLSHDIECAGANSTNIYTGLPQSRFPVALWTPAEIMANVRQQHTQFEIYLAKSLNEGGEEDARYKAMHAIEADMNDAVNAIIGTLSNRSQFNYWTNMMPWYEAVSELYRPLRPYLTIPDPLDTDPIIMIVAVTDIYNRPRERPLHFYDAQAFVYQHPQQEQCIDKTRDANATADLNDEFDCLKENVHIYTHELDMIAAFAEYVHFTKPATTTGWNIDMFDYPYEWMRCKFYNLYYPKKAYCEHGVARSLATPFGAPNFGMMREIPCVYKEGKKFSNTTTATPKEEEGEHAAGSDDEDEDVVIDEETGKVKKRNVKQKNNNPTRISQAMQEHIITPGIAHIDGIVVWRNASFGVKSVMKSKGNVSQFTLDNVSAIELKYPNTSRPRRKLQVAHSETHALWKRGGKELWFFICYCYVDATLPLFLLEKHAKIQLLFSISSICNISMEQVYNNGMQIKVTSLFYDQCRRIYDGKYLVPDWGRRGLHWPDIWLDADPIAAGKTNPQFKPVPPGLKGYMGAWVHDPTRMFHLGPIFTNDFTSLYPSIAYSYDFDYNKFLTKMTIDHYKLRANTYTPQVLGTHKVIFCGEPYEDEASAMYDQYPTANLKVTYWHIQSEGVLSSIIQMLFANRSQHKKAMAKWTYYEKMLSIPESEYPPHDTTTWNPETLAPLDLVDKLGAYRKTMLEVARTRAGWDAALAAITKETALHALPGETDLEYVAGVQIDVANAFQLGFKLILNSTYGYTTTSKESASLPLMEVGASITSMGRRVIRLTYSYSETQTIERLKADLAKGKQPWLLSYTAQPDAALGDLMPYEANLFAAKDSMIVFDDAVDVLRPEDAIYDQDMLEHVDTELRQLYAAKHLPSHFQLHGGDTDSVMLGHARKYCENGLELSIRMATRLVETINNFLRGCMGLTQEKMSKQSLFVDRKNYFMYLTTMSSLLCKGVEIVRGDTIYFVSRILTKASNDLLRITDAASFELTFMRVFRYIQRELYRFVRGQIGISELILHKKLTKFDYADPPAHAKVAEKMRMRGDKVNVGDFIEYVYVLTESTPEIEAKRFREYKNSGQVKNFDARATDIAENVNYAIENNLPLDHRFYWEHNIRNPVSKFFRHILAPKVYPPIFDTLSPKEKIKVQSFRASVRKMQESEIDALLFKPITQILEKEQLYHRNRNRMLQVMRVRTIESSMFKQAMVECQACNQYFATDQRAVIENPVCPMCIQTARDTIHSVNQAITRNAQEIITLDNECRECVRLSGFPDTDIERCTKFDCEVYEQRSRVKIDTAEKKQKIARLRNHVVIEFDDDTPDHHKKARMDNM